MRRVTIIERPTETYRFAATDQQTGHSASADRPGCAGCSLPAAGVGSAGAGETCRVRPAACSSLCATREVTPPVKVNIDIDWAVPRNTRARIAAGAGRGFEPGLQDTCNGHPATRVAASLPVWRHEVRRWRLSVDPKGFHIYSDSLGRCGSARTILKTHLEQDQ